MLYIQGKEQKTIEPSMFNTKKGCKKNDNMGGNVSFMYLALTVIIVTKMLLLLLLFYLIAIEILFLLLLFYLIVIKILLLFYLQVVLTPLVNLGSKLICPT